MNEGTGRKLFDLSGRFNHVPLVNMDGSNWVTGRSGKSLVFNGTNQYGGLGDVDDLNMGTSDFSISAWINMASVGVYATIFDKRVDNPDPTGYFWGYRDGDGSHKMSAFITDMSDSIEVKGLTQLQTNTLYHVVLTVKRGGDITHYLNGFYDNAESCASVTGTISSTGNATIGDGSTGIPTAWTNFPGLIEDMRIFKRVISAEEVRELYFNPYVMFEEEDDFGLVPGIPTSNIKSISSIPISNIKSIAGVDEVDIKSVSGIGNY